MRKTLATLFWQFIHNAIAHPLLGIFGARKWVIALHDRSADQWTASEQKAGENGMSNPLGIASAALRLGKSYPANAAILVIVALVAVWYFGSSFISGARSAWTDYQTSKTEQAAKGEQAAAATEIERSREYGVEREIEDRLREATITPERERTARASSEARERSRRSIENYEQSKTDFNRAGLDDLNLHRRNCADLAELYPGRRFARCE